MKFTVSGALPEVTDGTFEALTPLVTLGFASTTRTAVLTPAGAGTPRAAPSGPLAAPSGPQLSAPGTEKELFTTVARPVDASYGEPLMGSFGGGGLVVPVVRFSVKGPTPQPEPRSKPPAVPVMLMRSEMFSVATPVSGLSVPVPGPVGRICTVSTPPWANW